ncbi:MAG: hypothetical protein HYV55_01145 [Parcubacteria group bacterium]|nr:hypothetical protein [Parcubacteria group bacterium]
MMQIFLFFLMVGSVFLQVSFFPAFAFIRNIPVLLPFMVLLVVLHTNRLSTTFAVASLAGFFADAFSSHFFGFWMIIAVCVVVLGHWFLNSYGRLPIFRKA